MRPLRLRSSIHHQGQGQAELLAWHTLQLRWLGRNTPRIDTDEEEPQRLSHLILATVPNSPGRDPRALQPDSLQTSTPTTNLDIKKPSSVPRQT